MKFLTAILLLASTTVFAQTKVINEKGSVRLDNLTCVTRASSLSSYTALTNPYRNELLHVIERFVHPQSEIKLTHTLLSTPGCELTKLKKISDDSINTFMYATVDLKITQETKKLAAQCLEQLTETIEADLGEGIILSSEQVRVDRIPNCP